MPVWPAAFVPMVQVHMPSNQSVQIALRNDMMVRDVLNVSCEVGGHVSTLYSLAALYG